MSDWPGSSSSDRMNFSDAPGAKYDPYVFFLFVFFLLTTLPPPPTPLEQPTTLRRVHRSRRKRHGPVDEESLEEGKSPPRHPTKELAKNVCPDQARPARRRRSEALLPHQESLRPGDGPHRGTGDGGQMRRRGLVRPSDPSQRGPGPEEPGRRATYSPRLLGHHGSLKVVFFFKKNLIHLLLHPPPHCELVRRRPWHKKKRLRKDSGKKKL